MKCEICLGEGHYWVQQKEMVKVDCSCRVKAEKPKCLTCRGEGFYQVNRVKTTCHCQIKKEEFPLTLKELKEGIEHICDKEEPRKLWHRLRATYYSYVTSEELPEVGFKRVAKTAIDAVKEVLEKEMSIDYVCPHYIQLKKRLDELL